MIFFSGAKDELLRNYKSFKVSLSGEKAFVIRWKILDPVLDWELKALPI